MIIRLFNVTHFLVLGFTVGLAVSVYYLLRKKSMKTRRTVLICIAGTNAFSYFIDILRQHGTSNIWENLPLHLCGLSLFICLYSIIFRNKLVRSFVYFIASPGAFMALLTPNSANLGISLFTVDNLFFYGNHLFITVFGFWLVTLGFVRLNIKLMLKSCAMFFVIAGIMHFINLAIYGLGLGDANYFFTRTTPGNPLLDIFWKIMPVSFFYLLPALPILVVVCYLLYVPVSKKFKDVNTAA